MGLSGQCALASKTRVGKNLFGRAKSHLKTATQPAESQQEKRATNEKIASGAPHYRARYYSPNIGRFISRDPLGSPLMMVAATDPSGSAELSQGPNLYWYVQDNPAKKTDPTGNFGWIYDSSCNGIQEGECVLFCELSGQVAVGCYIESIWDYEIDGADIILHKFIVQHCLCEPCAPDYDGMQA